MKTFLFLIFTGLTFSQVAIAQSKVVVIPLGGDTVFEVKPGQTLSGQISARLPTDGSFAIAGDSFPAPLPSSTPFPSFEYTTTSTINCPGVGNAATGYLCVYGYNTQGVNNVYYAGQSTAFTRLHGFGLEITQMGVISNGYFLASWAYKIPG